ncbi:MAG: Rho termination factor N-terminal domain-containing protein [Desulfobacterales bacterium]
MTEDKKEEETAKPLEKMTVTALKEMAKGMSEIQGVSGMKKAELISAIEAARDIEPEAAGDEAAEAETTQDEVVESETAQVQDEVSEPGAVKDDVSEPKAVKDKVIKKTDDGNPITLELKKKIRTLKSQREAALEAKDKKMATIYRRQISRLKRKTRKAA